MDVVCVEFGTFESALDALQSCRGRPLEGRFLVRCGHHQESPVPPGITVLPLTRNPGFGAACNRGAEHGKADWILFLNPDCRLLPGDLGRMLDCAREVRGLGALGPAIHEGPGKVGRSHGVDLSSWRRLFDPASSPRGQALVDWVAGTCMLVRRQAFEEVGGFDQDFFLYCEDADLGLRLRQQGWRVMVTGRVSVNHRGGCSFEGPESRRAAYRDGREVYMRKHAGGLMRLLWHLWQAGQTWKEAV